MALKLSKLVHFIVALLILLNPSVSLAAEVKLIENGYHVVVATYSQRQEREAIQYSESLNKKGYHAGYGLEKGKRLIYVFVQSFDFDHYTAAVKAMLEVRKQSEFATAWVVKIKDGKEIKEGEPVTELVKEEPKKDSVVNIVTEYIDNPPMTPIPSPQHLGNTPVFLSTFRDRDNTAVNATIKVMDGDRVITTVKSNHYLNLPNPRTKSGKITLVASAFGYSDAKVVVGYLTTEQDTVQNHVVLFGSYFQFIFPMTKMNVGQEVTLSNVSFFNEAAIMTPSSKDQLNNLLDMLKENATAHIRLNGYTNGNGRGKIIYMGPSKNFFAMTADRVEKSGSAKDLSAARAEVIKSWLVDQGIDATRIEAAGWGGDKPIFDKDSPNARKNARVELEITQ